jgi:hypothetical protein
MHLMLLIQICFYAGYSFDMVLHTVEVGELQLPLPMVHFFPQTCFSGKSLLSVTIMEGSHCLMTPRNVYTVLILFDGGGGGWEEGGWDLSGI